MKRMLAIDQGNSSAKLYVFEDENIVERMRVEQLSPTLLAELLSRYSFSSVVLSSVAGIDSDIDELISSRCSGFVRLTPDTSLPIGIEYQHRETLGADRIAAAVGATVLFPEGNILVVDAGTAVTIDYVDASPAFRGGNISPGLKLRFLSLHRFTDRLPLENAEGVEGLLGTDTVTAIKRGVVNGMRFELEGYLNRLEREHPGVKVVITGGDAELLAADLHTSVPVIVDNDLIAKGLYRISNYIE